MPRATTSCAGNWSSVLPLNLLCPDESGTVREIALNLLVTPNDDVVFLPGQWAFFENLERRQFASQIVN